MPNERRYRQVDFRTRLNWNDLDSDYLRQIIGLAKIEDLAGAGLIDRPNQLGDISTMLMPEESNGTAQLVAREPLIICGLKLVPLILEAYGKTVDFKTDFKDGDPVAAGESIGTFSGSAIALLQAERVILNFLHENTSMHYTQIQPPYSILARPCPATVYYKNMLLPAVAATTIVSDSLTA
jgi:nicotinate-nucleotide pyrophosphorylase (carboxylating)